MNSTPQNSQQDNLLVGMDTNTIKALLNDRLRRVVPLVSFETLSIHTMLYDPGHTFRAVYYADVVNGESSEKQILYGRVLPRGDWARYFSKFQNRSARYHFKLPLLGEPVYCLPEIGMVVWVFPNDPRLKTLVPLQETDRLRSTLASFENRSGWDVGAVQQQLVRYNPGRRAVFCYDVEWRRPQLSDGTPAAHPASEFESIYCKIYRSGIEAREIWNVIQDLWRVSRSDSHFFTIPEPLHLQEPLCAMWLSKLPGTVVRQRLEPSTETMFQIGHGLALIQQARVHPTRRYRLEDELESVRKNAARILRRRPELRPQLAELTGGLEEILPSLPRMPLVPTHGSFKLSHLFQEGEQIGLLDFDSMVLADPVFDLANFESDLHYLEAQGSLGPGRARILTRKFQEGYFQQVPWPPRRNVLDWHVACLLVRKQAYKCVKHQHADALVKARKTLDEALRRVRRLA